MLRPLFSIGISLNYSQKGSFLILSLFLLLSIRLRNLISISFFVFQLLLKTRMRKLMLIQLLSFQFLVLSLEVKLFSKKDFISLRYSPFISTKLPYYSSLFSSTYSPWNWNTFFHLYIYLYISCLFSVVPIIIPFVFTVFILMFFSDSSRSNGLTLACNHHHKQHNLTVIDHPFLFSNIRNVGTLETIYITSVHHRVLH